MPGLFLPSALFVPVSLEALAALVLRHLQTTFLFQITHGVEIVVKAERAGPAHRCKARIYPAGI